MSEKKNTYTFLTHCDHKESYLLPTKGYLICISTLKILIIFIKQNIIFMAYMITFVMNSSMYFPHNCLQVF